MTQHIPSRFCLDPLSDGVNAMSNTDTITNENWPRHPDGRRKTFGEMTTQQKHAVVRGSVDRMKYSPPVSGSSPLVSDIPMKGPAMSHPANNVYSLLERIAKQQPVKIPVSGANAADILRVRESLDLTLTMAASIAKEEVANLNSNLSAAETINLDRFFAHLEDARDELLGQLTRAANRME